MATAANIGLRSADRRMRELTIASPGAGGLVLEELEENLEADQCSELQNVWFRGDVLARRPGQELVFDTGKGTIRALWRRPYGGKCVFTAGGALWAGETEAEYLRELKGDGEGCFFLFGGRLYFLGGGEYLVYDGIEVREVTPYTPTVQTDRSPDGSRGEWEEDYNRIGGDYVNVFSPSLGSDGTLPAVYRLTAGGLSAAGVEVTVDGRKLSEGSDYTLDRTAGCVTFQSPPAAGKNRVRILAHREPRDGAADFLRCRRAVSFGGENEMRVFFAGGGRSEYFWSEALDPSYIPEKNRAELGDGSEDITAFGEQYNRLIIFKPGEVWSMEYRPDGSDVFPVSPINRSIGCDAPETVCLVNNRLVWLSTARGVCTLLSTSLSAEKNVQPISRNIDGNDRRKGLLSEEGLAGAVACEWQGCYILAVNGRCYLWDARRTPYIHSSDTRKAQGGLAWYRWTGVEAEAFCTAGSELYYSAAGRLCRFYDRYIDFGERFLSRIRVPLRDFGFPDRYKNVLFAYVTVRGDVNNALEAACVTEREAAGTPMEREVRAVSFDLSHWDLADFTLEAVNFQKTVRLRPHRRRVMLFGMEFSCDAPDREMNVCSVTYRYRTVGQVK